MESFKKTSQLTLKEYMVSPEGLVTQYLAVSQNEKIQKTIVENFDLKMVSGDKKICFFTYAESYFKHVGTHAVHKEYYRKIRICKRI